MTMNVSAEEAAQATLTAIRRCIDDRRSFLLEAGAGAGKTYSLVKALQYLVEQQGSDLLRRGQKVACITYTNVASAQIRSRTDDHPAILSSTIHSFCWGLIRDFQPFLRAKLPELPHWDTWLQETGGIQERRIDYDMGHPSASGDKILLGHQDVLSLTASLMEQAKFRQRWVSRYPVLFIDEYQDTDAGFVEALKTYFLDGQHGPLIGCFGDHWQQIYDTGSGKIAHERLEVIEKHVNFRSASAIVSILNQMRPELIQVAAHDFGEGSAVVYHTNGWEGHRLTGSAWKGDLPDDVAHDVLERLKMQLVAKGWDFTRHKSKILMLTHKVLANEQGYSNIARVFGKPELYVKKEDRLIAFLINAVEPACIAYENRRFGELFDIVGGGRPILHSYADKMAWAKDMNNLLELRSVGLIGDVLDLLMRTSRIPMTDALAQELSLCQEPTSESERCQKLRDIRCIPYREVSALFQFVTEMTPFATQHGVKGDEFENVLVVCGRGWPQYNFGEYLRWTDADVPQNKRDFFERNRNLFYVACSRPVKRLALLFTQELSEEAMATLSRWFGESIYPIEFSGARVR